jgi:hypothetical protein
VPHLVCMVELLVSWSVTVLLSGAEKNITIDREGTQTEGMFIL